MGRRRVKTQRRISVDEQRFTTCIFEILFSLHHDHFPCWLRVSNFLQLNALGVLRCILRFNPILRSSNKRNIVSSKSETSGIHSQPGARWLFNYRGGFQARPTVQKNQRRVCTLFTQLSKNSRAQQNPTERSHATKNVYSLLCKPRPQIPHDLKNRVSVCLKTHHDLLLNPPNNTKLSGLFDLGVYQDNTHSNGGLTRF